MKKIILILALLFIVFVSACAKTEETTQLEARSPVNINTASDNDIEKLFGDALFF